MIPSEDTRRGAMGRLVQRALGALTDPGALPPACLATGAVIGLADAAVACSRELGAGALAVGPAERVATLCLGLAGGGMAALPLAVLGGAAASLLQRTPRRVRGLVVLAACSLVLWLLGHSIHLERIEWSALDPWLPWSLVLALCVLVAALGLVRPGARTARRAVAGGTVLLCAGALVGFSLAGPDARTWALSAIDRGSVWLSPLVQRASRALDADGDLYPRLLCGRACDCDDGRASVHPQAAEIVDNGIDEDCDGHDASGAASAVLTAVTPETEAAELAGATAADAGAATPARPPDVLFVVIDTLRPDHLGAYGYARPTSPRIDSLAARAVVFEQARSAGPSTRFSMPALLSSKWFTELERNDYEWPAISQHEVLLGERLKPLGYTLAAFHSIRYFRPYFGLGQGFDHWSDAALDARKPELKMISSDYVTDEVLSWVDQWLDSQANEPARPPLFLWAYYGDPHAAYVRHPEPFRFGNASIDRYDGEIAFTDHHVGRLLDGLAARGFGDDLIVVLTSDHGEALDRELDHGSLNHSKSLYDELIHVPLLVAGPGFTPKRIATPVSLIDLLPTFLALAGAPVPEELRGVSLIPWLARDPDAKDAEQAHPPLFFEKHRAVDDPQKGMLAWPYKVIATLPAGRVQIFDVRRDPHEQNDIREQLPTDERERLEGMLWHWASQVLKPARRNYRH